MCRAGLIRRSGLAGNSYSLDSTREAGFDLNVAFAAVEMFGEGLYQTFVCGTVDSSFLDENDERTVALGLDKWAFFAARFHLHGYSHRTNLD